MAWLSVNTCICAMISNHLSVITQPLFSATLSRSTYAYLSAVSDLEVKWLGQFP